MLGWLIRPGMATSVLASATSRRLRQQQGMPIRSKLSMAGCSLGTVLAAWSIVLRWALKLLVASPRRCALCSLTCLSLRRQLSPHYLLLINGTAGLLPAGCFFWDCEDGSAVGAERYLACSGGSDHSDMLKQRRSQGQLARNLSSFSAAFERHTD